MDRIGLICRYIKEDPRSTQRDLAQKTGFSVGTVNTLIKEAMQQRLRFHWYTRLRSAYRNR